MKITCKKTRVTGKADPMIYGHFLEHHHRQVYGGVFDPSSRFADEDGFREDVIEALRRIRTPIIRWPGGCYVSAYDWRLGVGKDRIPAFDKAWRIEEPNTFGTDEFVKLCRKIGCEPYICTNAGTGTAEEMSRWVEYCNLGTMGRFAKERIANGYRDPHKVRYWSIGNENWGAHEMGAKNADEWASLVRESAKMMLRVDPSVELSAASIADLDWNLKLLRAAGRYLKWVSIHCYFYRSPDGRTSADYRTLMLKTGEDIASYIKKVRAYLTALGLEKQIRISLDEWNLRAWHHPFVYEEDEELYQKKFSETKAVNDENAVYTMADAVFTASFLNVCLRNCDLVGMACFSPVVNTRGAIFTYGDGIVLRPQYYVFELYANLLKENVLDIWSEDVPVMTGIDATRGPAAEKTVDTVDLVVTCGEGGYAIAAVNKDPEKEQSFELTLLGDKVSRMRVHTLNGPSPDSYNDVGRTEVSVRETEWTPFTGSVTLAPHSVNVIELN